MRKTDKVFARIGFSDIIVPIENAEDTYSGTDTFLVGYEDENGEECDEDGTYLNQKG